MSRVLIVSQKGLCPPYPSTANHFRYLFLLLLYESMNGLLYSFRKMFERRFSPATIADFSRTLGNERTNNERHIRYVDSESFHYPNGDS